MNHDIQPTKTETLAHRLMLMAEAGGMITRDRRKTIMESAGRLTDLQETLDTIQSHMGGDADEKR